MLNFALFPQRCDLYSRLILICSTLLFFFFLAPATYPLENTVLKRTDLPLKESQTHLSPFFKANPLGRISQCRPTLILLEQNEKPLSRHCIRRMAALLVPLSLLPPPASLTTSGHAGAQTARTDQNPDYMPSASSFQLLAHDVTNPDQ